MRFKNVPFSKRPIKQSPFSQRANDPKSREAARDTRRKLFLQQVAQKRDEQRFEERGDHLLRLDWKGERRRWEDEKAKSASSWSDQPEEVEDIPLASQPELTFPPASQINAMSTPDEAMQGQSAEEEEKEAERLRQQEEGEIEELLALMDEEGSQHSSRYGSEDEYDGIFSELIEDDGGGNTSDIDDFIIVERQDDVDMSG